MEFIIFNRRTSEFVKTLAENKEDACQRADSAAGECEVWVFDKSNGWQADKDNVLFTDVSPTNQTAFIFALAGQGIKGKIDIIKTTQSLEQMTKRAIQDKDNFTFVIRSDKKVLHKGITRDKSDGERELLRYQTDYPNAAIQWNGPFDNEEGIAFLVDIWKKEENPSKMDLARVNAGMAKRSFLKGIF